MRGFFLGIFPEVPWSYWTWSEALGTSLLTAGWRVTPKTHSLHFFTSLWVEWKLLIHEAKAQSSWWAEQRLEGRWVEAQSSCGKKNTYVCMVAVCCSNWYCLRIYGWLLVSVFSKFLFLWPTAYYEKIFAINREKLQNKIFKFIEML